jgi:hypothetical protein
MAKGKTSRARKPRVWNGAGVASDQARQGRRGASLFKKVPGLKDWVKERLAAGATQPEIVAALPATGFWRKLQDLGYERGIPRSTLSENIVGLVAREREKELLIALAESYNATGSDAGVLKIETAIAGLVNADILYAFLEARNAGRPLPADRIEEFRKFAAMTAALQKAKHWIDHGRTEMLTVMEAEFLELFRDDAEATRVVLAKFAELRNKKENP